MSEREKAGQDPVRCEPLKSNESEPLMTCRNVLDDVKTGVESYHRDKVGRHLVTARSASGIKAARARFRPLRGT